MHEYSITQSLLDLVLKQANEAGAGEVSKINLVIGEMTGVVDDSVRFYFDLLSKGTIAEGACLSLRMVPVTGRCRECGQPFPLQEASWTCPYCGNNGIDIVSGRELMVESLEIN